MRPVSNGARAWKVDIERSSPVKPHDGQRSTALASMDFPLSENSKIGCLEINK